MTKSCLDGILLTFPPGGPLFNDSRDITEVDVLKRYSINTTSMTAYLHVSLLVDWA